jgi:nicotinamide-nucleotide amidase
MPHAYIISTGSELLQGTTLDSNSTFLASRLRKLGIKVVGIITVGDNQESLSQAFKLAVAAADIVISSGGLGPTFDDLTKIIACEVMDCELKNRPEEEERLRAYFANRVRSMPEINLRQAMFPTEAIALRNRAGTAPGMYLQKKRKTVILLPGPPGEMIPMYKDEVEPRLKEDFGTDVLKLLTRTIKTLGLGESQVEERLGSLMNVSEAISIALLAIEGEVHIRLAAETSARNDRRAALDGLTAQIVEQLAENVFAVDDETLVSKLAGLLLAQGKTLAAAESCTGGLLSKMVTDLPGSSRYFWGGAVTYSNQAKQRLLGVNEETLQKYGAVSSETAREMAQGMRQVAGTDFALAITGIAGPEGGSSEKPVGLVYIALDHAQGSEVRRLRFGSGRDLIRILSAKSALDLLRRHLQYQ